MSWPRYSARGGRTAGNRWRDPEGLAGGKRSLRRRAGERGRRGRGRGPSGGQLPIEGRDERDRCILLRSMAKRDGCTGATVTETSRERVSSNPLQALRTGSCSGWAVRTSRREAQPSGRGSLSLCGRCVLRLACSHPKLKPGGREVRRVQHVHSSEVRDQASLQGGAPVSVIFGIGRDERDRSRRVGFA